MNKTDPGVTQVVRSKSPPFFKACIDEMRIAGMDVAHKYEWAQVKVPDHILPKARARVARNGGAHSAPAGPVSRVVTLTTQDGTRDRMCFAASETAALVVHRVELHPDCPDWMITHAASGRYVEMHTDTPRAVALARAAAIEAACPSCGAVDYAQPETVAAFKAEYQIFKEGNGA